MTIESVTQAKDLEMRKMLALNPKCVVFPTICGGKRLTNSAVISSIALLAEAIKTTKGGDTIFVVPFSILALKRTEMYDIGIKLLGALNISAHRHIVVCIDGSENYALEECFDCENIEWTLDELAAVRSIITGDVRDDIFISENNVVVRDGNDNGMIYINTPSYKYMGAMGST
jgi:hypothetical protein